MVFIENFPGFASPILNPIKYLYLAWTFDRKFIKITGAHLVL